MIDFNITVYFFSKIIFIFYVLFNFLFQTFPQFNPGIIVVGFCFSMNSDVSWLLRRCGISATMFLTHDLRTITNNPLAELNEVQRQLLKEIGNFIFQIIS